MPNLWHREAHPGRSQRRMGERRRSASSLKFVPVSPLAAIKKRILSAHSSSCRSAGDAQVRRTSPLKKGRRAELRFTDVESIRAAFQETGLELPKRLLQGASGEAGGGPSGQARRMDLRKRRLELPEAGLEAGSKGD